MMIVLKLFISAWKAVYTLVNQEVRKLFFPVSIFFSKNEKPHLHFSYKYTLVGFT